MAEVDQRNLLLLVEEEFEERMSVLPRGAANAYASVLTRCELYLDYNLDPTFMLQWVRHNLALRVSEGGRGRDDMVAASRAEQGGIVDDGRHLRPLPLNGQAPSPKDQREEKSKSPLKRIGEFAFGR